jgi:signal transduction histidine kinase
MTPVTPNTTPVKGLAWTCLIVVVTAIAATLLRMALAPLVGISVPFLTYFLGVLFVAWYRGLGAAVLLILLSTVAGWYFFVLPANPLGTAEPTRVLGFLAASSAAAFLLDLQRRTLSRAKRLEHERLDAQAKAQALASEKALREMEAELARVVRALSVGELAASIAHEVNQPLAGVVTNAEAALRWLSGDTPNLHEVKESLALIVRDGHRASAIIRRIREFLKKQRAEMLSLDMNETIQEAVALAQPELLKRRITLRIDRSKPLPAVRGDRVQLQQVILNLILNGSEAMASTNESKELLLTSRQSADGGVLIAVRDSGVGVKPEELSRLFDPFFTTKEMGMGLGLSISKSIIEAHRGRIWAESNQGPGLTVQFSVPPESPGPQLFDHESGT